MNKDNEKNNKGKGFTTKEKKKKLTAKLFFPVSAEMMYKCLVWPELLMTDRSWAWSAKRTQENIRKRFFFT